MYVSVCVCVVHVCTRNFPFVNFSLCAERCRFSRFRRASNIDEAAAVPAAAWQPDRYSNNNNNKSKPGLANKLSAYEFVCACVRVSICKKKNRKICVEQKSKFKNKWKTTAEVVCWTRPSPAAVSCLFIQPMRVCAKKLKWLPGSHVCACVCNKIF